MSNTTLGDICDINPESGGQLESGEVCSFVPMEAIDEIFGVIDRPLKRLYEDVARGYTRFIEGDVLFAKITPCMENGKCAIADRLLNGLGFGSTEFHVLRPKIGVLPEWVFYFLRQPHVRAHAERRMTGSAGQKRVPEHVLGDLEIRKADVDEQRRITSLLRRVEYLRRRMQFARGLSDSLLESIFIESFGDPFRNPKDWPMEALGDLLAERPRIGTTVPAGDEGQQLCVRVGEIGDWYVNLADCQRVSLTGSTLQRFTLLSGDIVLARAIGSEEHLGKSSVFERSQRPVVFDSHVMRLRPSSDRVCPFFLAFWFRTQGGRARFMRQARRTAVQFNINSEQISELQIPLPPRPLQERFAAIGKSFRRFAVRQHEAERRTQQLFQALLNLSYTGNSKAKAAPELGA